jgi:hypothetical protein
MTTEAYKDKGIDEILHMNIPDKDKAHFIGDLCKHRGKCMDEDREMIDSLKAGIEAYSKSNAHLREALVSYKRRHDNRLANRILMALNNWAKP